MCVSCSRLTLTLLLGLALAVLVSPHSLLLTLSLTLWRLKLCAEDDLKTRRIEGIRLEATYTTVHHPFILLGLLHFPTDFFLGVFLDRRVSCLVDGGKETLGYLPFYRFAIVPSCFSFLSSLLSSTHPIPSHPIPSFPFLSHPSHPIRG